MADFSVQEIEMRLFICKKALEWLHSGDPMLKDPQYAALVPGAIEIYTSQFNELVEARKRKLAAVEPVTVGLKPARLKPIVPKVGG